MHDKPFSNLKCAFYQASTQKCGYVSNHSNKRLLKMLIMKLKNFFKFYTSNCQLTMSKMFSSVFPRLCYTTCISLGFFVVNKLILDYKMIYLTNDVIHQIVKNNTMEVQRIVPVQKINKSCNMQISFQTNLQSTYLTMLDIFYFFFLHKNTA